MSRLCTVLAVFLCPLALSAQEAATALKLPFVEAIFEQLGANPWSDVEVGEVAKYAVLDVGDLFGGSISGSLRLKVHALEDTLVTVLLEGEIAEQQSRVLAPTPTDRWLHFDAKSMAGIEDLGLEIAEEYSVGEDTLRVGDREVPCKKLELAVFLESLFLHGDASVWYSPEVPVYGILQIELRFAIGDLKSTITATHVREEEEEDDDDGS